jgi:hypothetical protein
VPVNIKVVADTDKIGYPVDIQIFNPNFADKFTVCCQAVNPVLPKQTNKPVHDFDSLAGMGVTALV